MTGLGVKVMQQFQVRKRKNQARMSLLGRLLRSVGIQSAHLLLLKEEVGLKEVLSMSQKPKMFANFLRKKGMDEMASKVESFGVQIPHLDWVQPKNDVYVDCVIYVMRHMETFMGEGRNKWKHGLNPKSTNQLKYLRATYCAAIAIAGCNEKKQSIVNDFGRFFLTLSNTNRLDLEVELLS